MLRYCLLLAPCLVISTAQQPSKGGCVNSPVYAKQVQKPLCEKKKRPTETPRSNLHSSGMSVSSQSSSKQPTTLPSSGSERGRALRAGIALAQRYHSEDCLSARTKKRFDSILSGVVGGHWKTQEVNFLHHAPHLAKDFGRGLFPTQNQENRSRLLATSKATTTSAVYIRNQKVASTMFWNEGRYYAGVKGNFARWPFRRSGGKEGREKLHNTNCDPSTIYFTFVREPIQTFISGWMQDMCFVKHMLTEKDRSAPGTGEALRTASGRHPIMWTNATAAFLLFVNDFKRGKFLSNAASHVWPQADKIDVAFNQNCHFDFIGQSETFEASMSAIFPGGQLVRSHHFLSSY